MGREHTPCCSYVGLSKGPWTPEEDLRLIKYIEAHGEGNWRTLPRKAGSKNIRLFAFLIVSSDRYIRLLILLLHLIGVVPR